LLTGIRFWLAPWLIASFIAWFVRVLFLVWCPDPRGVIALAPGIAQQERARQTNDQTATPE
jgi:hypothetical protein